jgi:hypothetical protein
MSMFTLVRIRRRSRWLLGVIGLGVVAGAAPLPDNAPLARSPFLPPEQAAGAAPAPTSQGSWQFSGILGSGPGALFCVVNTETRRSYWLPVGGAAVDGLVVRSYDATNDTLVVQSQGGPTLTLRLQSVQVGSRPPSAVAPTPMPVAGNVPPQPTPANRPGGPAAMPASEAERLQAVAEEVRRRRALRQATIEQQRTNAAAEGR